MVQKSLRGNVAVIGGYLALCLIAIYPMPEARATMTMPEARMTGAVSASTLDQAAARGLRIFNHDTFGGTRTCSTCHSNDGTTMGRLPNGVSIPSLIGVAARFPKYKPRAHRVVTLEQQLVHCIRGGLQGKPPAAGSSQMTDLITYLTKLSKGAVIGKQFK